MERWPCESKELREGVYREERLSSVRAIVGVAELGRVEGVELSPTKVRGLLVGEVGEEVAMSGTEELLSLCRYRRKFDFELGLSGSLYNVDESAVETDALGDPGRPSGLISRYARSRSTRFLAMAYLLSSVPFAVRVGFVMGAEITAVLFPRSPWDMVFTVTGDFCGGASLWYGTELRSWLVETEDCLGRLLFLPKNESIVCQIEVETSPYVE